MLGKLIRNILVNDTDISAIVGTKVFPFLASDDIAYPYIIIDKEGHDAEDTKDGVSCLDVIEYQILMFSETNAELSDLGIKVRNALDRYSGTLEGLEVQSTRFTGENLDYSDVDRVFGLGQTYSFRYIPIYGILSRVTDLSGVKNGKTQIDLSWTDSTTGESGFEVWRSLDTETWALIATTAANATSYSDTGLSSATAYIYKIRPTDGTNGSEWSNIISVATDGGTAASGIAYQRPVLTGQLTSYETYDDGWNLANNVYDYTMPTNPVSVAQLDSTHATPFLKLVSNNAFGNKDRFTDDGGLQTYANDYVIDHLTGLGYIRVPKTTQVWATAVSTAAALTEITFSDWRLTNRSEIESIIQFDAGTSDVLNYAPFNIVLGLYTSTTEATAIRVYELLGSTSGNLQRIAKTQSRQYIVVRNHYT